MREILFLLGAVLFAACAVWVHGQVEVPAARGGSASDVIPFIWSRLDDPLDDPDARWFRVIWEDGRRMLFRESEVEVLAYYPAGPWGADHPYVLLQTSAKTWRLDFATQEDADELREAMFSRGRQVREEASGASPDPPQKPDSGC